MKRLQLKKEQIEMVAGLYDGVNFFYNPEKEEVIMLEDVIDTDLSSISFKKDTSVIVPVSDIMLEILPLLDKYTLDNSVNLPRSLTQKMRSDDTKLFRLLGLGNVLATANFVESVDEPDKSFLLIDLSYAHSEKSAEGKMESALKIIKSLEVDTYLYQHGKKCQKKVQK